MMSPSIMQQPDRMVVMGSGGSNRIRSSVLQQILHLEDLGLDTTQSVFVPRIHLEGETLNIEGGVSESILSDLEQIVPDQNRFDGRNFFFGGVHSVVVTPNEIHGTGDPRRAGVCITE